MPDDIVCAAVADSSGVLVSVVEYPVVGEVIVQLLNKENIDFLVDHKRSFSAHAKTHGHTIQYIVDDEICFICSAREGFPQRICFGFLECIKNEFANNYAAKPTSSAFEKFIREQMDFFSNNPDADKIRGLQSKVDQVTDIMHDNVAKLLARGERIEAIEGKAEDLGQKTNAFKKKTDEVWCAMCINNIKTTICLIVTIIAVLIGIAAVIFVITQFMGYPPLG
eukprot:TRINITY_DN9192_c1_g1_i1.p1 TRINITY_DN9192_c1_g1~~TRINITY_DN9192_c1_g1_i1.p1  ORF type:complete len:223 (-),score=79.58 TRINITY_DN9192_c1_g1_i1:155-823(-)